MKNKISTFDMVLISILSVLGVIIKPIIMPALSFITDFALVPGGSVAGGFNIMWIIIGTVCVKHRHTAKYMCFLQACLAIVTGTFSFHGILIFITYLAPGVVIDGVFDITRVSKKRYKLIIAGSLGNLAGSLMTNFLFFNLSLIPMIIFLLFAVIFGGVGGYCGYLMLRVIPKHYLERGIYNE